MSVERLPITPPTSEEGASLASCRLSLIRGVEILGEVTTRSTEEQVYTSLENANDALLDFARQTQEAQPKDCSRCLEGAGISCPGKTEQAQDQYGLLSLRGLTPIAARRLMKVTKEGGTLTNPLNRILALELQEKGYPQNIEYLPPPIVEEVLGNVVVVDPRPPGRREEELLEEFKEQRPH